MKRPLKRPPKHIAQRTAPAAPPEVGQELRSAQQEPALNVSSLRLVPVGGRFHWARQPGLILLAAILVVQLLGPFARYCPVGFLDSWIYTSYFIDWPDMVSRYSGAYYGTRIPYIAFGALLYKIFAPVVANSLVNMTQTWVICYSVYRILRRFYQPAPCLLYALALSINVGLLQPVLWDYPDGPAIAYGFLGLWFCFAPPVWASGLLGLFIGGAFYACSGHTIMIMGLVIAPAMLAQVTLAWRQGFRRVVMEQGAIVAGAGAATVIFGVLSVLVGGRFLFFAPQILQVIWTLSNRNYSTWEQPVSVWLPTAYRLLTPAGVLLLAGLRYFLRKRLSDRGDAVVPAFTVLLVGSSLLYAYSGLIKNALVLQVFYSSVFLLIPSLLYLGLLFCGCWQYLEGTDYKRLAAIVAGFLVLVFAAGPYIYAYEQAHGPRVLVYASMFGIALAAVILPVARKVALVGSAVLTLSFLIVSDLPLLADRSITGPAFAKQPPGFEVAVQVRQLVTFAPSKGRTVRFWFDKDEQNLPLFDSLASLYTWGSPSATGTLIEGTDEQRKSMTQPGELFVVLSSDPHKIEQDEALLAKYGIEFERRGLARVVRGPYDFYVGLLALPSKYVVNGAFGHDTAGWDAGNAQLDTQDGGQSGKCMVLTGVHGPTSYAIQHVAAGFEDHHVYQLSFWVKSGSSGDDQFQAGIWGGNKWIAMVQGATRPEWTKYTTQFEYRAGSSVSVELAKNSPKTGSMLFDTIALDEIQ